jgi:hypothetical protein
MADNSHTIKGIIYAIEHQVIKGKKKPEESYNKYLITLEIGGRYPTLPQLEYFGQSDLSAYSSGDLVEIDFELIGRKYNGKNGQESIITKATIRDIRYADLETKKNHIRHVNDSKVDYSKLMVEVDQPDISEMDKKDDLPFIIIALIGIGSLSPILNLISFLVVY